MDVLGVVCEYNPFHSGHAYHLQKSREIIGNDVPVVCVMSGDYVQRGEPAMFSKFARAEAACRCGADLVVELPLPWSISSAEGFARGAVGLLSKLGATHISFGSEIGETEPLISIAKELSSPAFMEAVRGELAENASASFAAARQAALEKRIGAPSELIRTPNNILAVEYIKAICEQKRNITPITVKRTGSGHDRSGDTSIKSASELRAMLLNGTDIKEYIPSAASEVYEREIACGRGPLSMTDYETALLARLRMLPSEAFEHLPDGADGIGRRLYAAVQEEASVADILAATKNKRYALARIRRMCMCAALGIREEMNAGIPPYARVLAANERGCELIKAAKGNIPIVTKPASVRALSAECTELFAVGASAHDFFVLGYSTTEGRKGGSDWRTGPKIVKND